MKRFLIEDVQFGITDACGCFGTPSGNVLVSIKYNNGKESKYLNLFDVGGIMDAYKTTKNVFNVLLAEDYEDQFDSKHICAYDRIPLEEYENAYKYIRKHPKNQSKDFVRFAMALLRMSNEDTNKLISESIGHYIDEINIPICDAEQDYLDSLNN